LIFRPAERLPCASQHFPFREFVTWHCRYLLERQAKTGTAHRLLWFAYRISGPRRIYAAGAACTSPHA